MKSMKPVISTVKQILMEETTGHQQSLKMQWKPNPVTKSKLNVGNHLGPRQEGLLHDTSDKLAISEIVPLTTTSL